MSPRALLAGVLVTLNIVGSLAILAAALVVIWAHLFS